MKRNKTILLAAVCALLLCCVQACSKAEAQQPVPGNGMFDSEVRIRAGGYEGGGTIIYAGKTFIVSAAHLLAHFDDGSEVRTLSGDVLSCSPLHIDPVTDIGILECDGTVPEKQLDHSGMLRTDTVREACPLAVVCLNAAHDGICSGFITGTDITFSGQEGSAGYMQILIDAEAGMSGCGIYDDSGRYAGMLTGRFETGGTADSEAVAACVDADSIMDAVDSLIGQ